MTTLQMKLKINCDIPELAERIFEHKNTIFDGDAVIQRVYYKNNDELVVHGDRNDEKKCFPKTLNIQCKSNKTFKIRLFYSKELKTLHCASGLSVANAKTYLFQLSRYMINPIYQTDVKTTLVNGLAQIKFGVDIKKTIDHFEKGGIKFSYTPKRNASLKLFSTNGTICLHSTGKVLYMGSKSEEDLMKLHERLQKMCADKFFDAAC